MIRAEISKKTKMSLMAFSVVLMVLGYSYVSHRQHVKNPNDTTLPSWGQMYDGMLNATITQESSLDGGWLLEDIEATSIRLFGGFFLSMFIGVILGMLMGCFNRIHALLIIPISVGANIPPTAVTPVFFALVGIGLQLHLSVLLLGIVPAFAMGVNLVAREFPDELKYKAYMLGNSHFEVMERNFKFSLPKIIEHVRAQVGPAIVYLVASEMLVSGEGMGFRIRLLSKKLEMDVVYPYIMLLALFGFLFKLFLKQSIDWVSPWFNKQQAR